LTWTFPSFLTKSNSATNEKILSEKIRDSFNYISSNRASMKMNSTTQLLVGLHVHLCEIFLKKVRFCWVNKKSQRLDVLAVGRPWLCSSHQVV